MADTERDTQPLVTEDELDLSLFVKRWRTLKIPIDRQVRDFQIRERLTVDELMHFAVLETRINGALETEDDEGLMKVLDESNAAIREIVAQHNDDLPESLGLDERQVLATLSWLSGDVTVADAIARALTAGASGAADEPSAAAGDGSDAEQVEVEGDARPLAST